MHDYILNIKGDYMTSCDDFIEKATKVLPELCTTNDLIKLGIYKSAQGATHARQTGRSADYFKLPTGTIVYPKKGIIELLKKSKHSSDGKCFNEDNHTGRPYSKGSSEVQKKGIRI